MRRLLTFVAVAASTGAFAQTPAAPPSADRSAEGRLKQVFAAVSKLKSLHSEIGIITRSDANLPYYPLGTLQFWWRSDGAFRVEHTGSWGDGMVLTSDGDTLLVDMLDIPSGVILKDAKPTVYGCDAALAMRGGISTPLFYFLAGDPGFAELVAKDGEIVACPGRSGEEGIRFKTTKLGTMRVFFNPKDRDLKPVRFEYDNRDFYNEMAEQLAEWGFEKPTDPMDVQAVRYLSVNRGLPKNLLSTAPPARLRVADLRAKKPAAPPVRV